MKANYFFIIYLFFSSVTFGQLSTLSDEFDGSVLNDSWNLFQTQFFDTPLKVDTGFMEMASNDANCNPTCVWYLDESAGFIYKNVTGDFDVVTAVSALQKTDPALDIDNDTQLTGLLARDPASTSSGLENYVFNVVGIRFDVPSVEVKSTQNDASTIHAYTDNMSTGTKAELRIVRQGNVFTLYSRPIGSSNWTLRYNFDRPDLPATLQVGMITYTYESYPANLLAKFDYIRFNEVGTLNVPTPKNQNFQIYPNPVENILNIKITNSIESAINIYMYDLFGRTIHFETRKLSNNDNPVMKLDLTGMNLQHGVYFLQLGSDKTNLGTYQLIKK